MKVIFLDVDGVLNYKDYIINNNNDIDINKLYLLKKLVTDTMSNIVLSSSWKKLSNKSLELELLFLKNGLKIIDKTEDLGDKRGQEIKNYLSKHENITNFIIIDDDIFSDFDEFLLSHLVKTSFYENGLEEKHIVLAKKILNNKI